MSLPEAQAAVLARLWGALGREPLPGVAGRDGHGATTTVRLTDGRAVVGPAAAAQLFAQPAPGLTVAGHTDPGALVTHVWGEAARRLREEIDDSVRNLARSRAAQPRHRPAPRDLVDFEQSVVDGHPVHPLCRSRIGLTEAEVAAYAPEYRPIVELEVLAVPPDRWTSTGTGLPPRLPVHPWQRDHVLDRYPGLTPTGHRVPARPLMSLRTLAPLDDPFHHLKTSLDVQLTSAVRRVSAAAIHNGPVLSALLQDLTPIEILAEVAGGAVLVDGAPCGSLAVIVRNAPTRPLTLPLAALSAPGPGGRPYLAEAVTVGYGGDPVPFLADLARLTLPPLLGLLRRGIALEAHGQNLLVVLDQGHPVGLAYRDLGGVRVHPGRLRAAGIDPPPLRGAIPTEDEDELVTKLLAALFVALGEVVATIARDYGVAPGRLWRVLPPDPLLDRPLMPVKATTAMRLAADPLDDLWAWVPNPLAEV